MHPSYEHCDRQLKGGYKYPKSTMEEKSMNNFYFEGQLITKGFNPVRFFNVSQLMETLEEGRKQPASVDTVSGKLSAFSFTRNKRVVSLLTRNWKARWLHWSNVAMNTYTVFQNMWMND